MPNNRVIINPNFKSNGEFHRSLKARGVGAKDFPNSHSEVVYLGNGKFGASIGIGHKVFFDKADGNKPKKHKLTDERPTKDYVLIQGAKCCTEVHPYYAKYFDTQHEEVRLYEERWVVQRLFKAPDEWRDVDSYNPVMSVEEYSESTGDVMKVSIVSDTDYGTLTVEYFQRDGNNLKHNVYFTNTSGSTGTFRVVQRWAGIVGDKVNGKDYPLITDESVLNFRKADGKLSVAENLRSMMFNPDGSEKTEKCLQRPISIEAHAQGMKADFIYAQWVLVQNESLEIDPGTATLDNPTEDGDIRDATARDNSDTYIYMAYTVQKHRAYVEWDVSGIDDGAIITNTVFKYHGGPWHANGYKSDCHINEILGARPSTSSNADLWAEIGEGTTYASPDGFPVVATNQQVDLGASADADLQAQLAVNNWFGIGIQLDDEVSWSGASYSGIRSEEYATPTPPPTLYVEYTAPPTVTTEAVDDIAATTATGNGTITAGAPCDKRGIVYDLATHGDPGDTAPAVSDYGDYEEEANGFGTGVFDRPLTGLTEVTTYYARAYAHNSEGYAYGDEVNFRTLFTPRSGTALLGEKGTATRVGTLVRADEASLGLLSTGSRAIVYTPRSATALLGLLSTGARAVAYDRVETALLGLKGTATRVLVLTRGNSALLGLLGAGVRVLTLIRADTALLGLKTTGLKYLVFTFSATALLGLKTTGVRTIVLSRADTALLGLKGTATRVLVLTRADDALLGLKSTGARAVAYARTNTALLGLRTAVYIAPAAETLRPNAAGDETALAKSGFGGANWDRVAEEFPDDGDTYVYAQSKTYRRDLYNVEPHAAGSGIINFIKVYSRCYGASTNNSDVVITIKSGTGAGDPDTIGESDENSLPWGWADDSFQWNTNPATGLAWTWDEIDRLQIGIALRETEYGWDTRCTQVYVEVDYGEEGALRILVLNRASSALLSLKTTGAKVLTLIRGATAILGYTPTGVRVLKLIRTATAYLGLKTTGVRTVVLTRGETALLGLKTTGVRVLTLIRANTSLLGLKTTATRVLALIRGATALLGFDPTGVRVLKLVRTATAYLGLKTTGVRVVAFSRVATALLGLTTTGVKVANFIRSATALLGLASTGTRVLVLTRIATTVLLGLLTTGKKVWIVGRIHLVSRAYALGKSMVRYTLGRSRDKYTLGKSKDHYDLGRMK